MLTYAQYGEDLTIDRLLGGLWDGFYVDVGAMDPDSMSVTKLFYQHRRCRGVNVEPCLRFWAKLMARRPEDINIRVLIGTAAKEVTLFQVPGGGSTTREDLLDIHRNKKIEPVVLPRIPLATLLGNLRKSGWEGGIDFMKVDVEGSEADVLASNDWNRFRPRLLCVERRLPFRKESSEHTFLPILEKAGYLKAEDDGTNGYYRSV